MSSTETEASTGGNESSTGGNETTKRSDELVTITAVLTVLIIIIVLAIWSAQRTKEGYKRARRPHEGKGAQTTHEGMAVSPDMMNFDDDPERRSVYAALGRLYSTADVDPMITGQLYDYADGVRYVYAERSAHGDGLQEYSSSGDIGDVGVTVGPIGLNEYGGKEEGYDDGIPAQWAMPSTPVQWYSTKQRDYYGQLGPTVYAEGLYTLSEPDHDPLMD